MSASFQGLVHNLPASWKQAFDRACEFQARYPRLRSVGWLAFALVFVTLVVHWRSGNWIMQQPFWLLPVPLFLNVFLQKPGDDPLLYGKASPRCMVLGTVGFFLSLFTSGLTQTVMLAMGVAGILCLFIDVHALRRLAASRRFATVTASVGALSGIAHYALQVTGAQWLARGSIYIVYLLLHRTIPYMQVFEQGYRIMFLPQTARSTQIPVRLFQRGIMPRSVPWIPGLPHPAHHRINFECMAVVSDHFSLCEPAFSNVGMGIFLFVVLLSLALLSSARQFTPARLARMVAGGVLTIFLVNALVLTLYFYMGELAHAELPDSMAVAIFSAMSFAISSSLLAVAGYALVALMLIHFYCKDLSFLRFHHRSAP